MYPSSSHRDVKVSKGRQASRQASRSQLGAMIRKGVKVHCRSIFQNRSSGRKGRTRKSQMHWYRLSIVTIMISVRISKKAMRHKILLKKHLPNQASRHCVQKAAGAAVIEVPKDRLVLNRSSCAARSAPVDAGSLAEDRPSYADQKKIKLR